LVDKACFKDKRRVLNKCNLILELLYLQVTNRRIKTRSLRKGIMER